mgnify:CR=1 FL=1
MTSFDATCRALRLSLFRPGALLAFVFLGVALLSGCEREPDPTTYVARVGGMVLTDEEMATMLSGLPANVDTAEARQQVVEQWVTRSLLLQEAERLNLRDDPAVQRRMKEQERSILVTALTDRIYAEAELGPSEAEIRNFFQSNRRQMVLREPFVRVRHLSTNTREQADSARTALQEAATAGRSLDSTFAALIDRYATFPNRAQRLTAKFVPESRLFGHRPYVRDELTELGGGEIAPVVQDDSLFHVLQLVERIPEGSEPELAWVEDEIRRRLTIRSRKQMYAREVQRLRNQALAQNDLQFGTPDTAGVATSNSETTKDAPTAPESVNSSTESVNSSDAPEGTAATPQPDSTPPASTPTATEPSAPDQNTDQAFEEPDPSVTKPDRIAGQEENEPAQSEPTGQDEVTDPDPREAGQTEADADPATAEPSDGRPPVTDEAGTNRPPPPSGDTLDTAAQRANLSDDDSLETDASEEDEPTDGPDESAPSAPADTTGAGREG